MEYPISKRIAPRYSVVNGHCFGLYPKCVACSIEMEGESALDRIFSDSEDDTSDEEVPDEDDGDPIACTRAPQGLDLYQVSLVAHYN